MATSRQIEIWQLFSDVCNDNGIPIVTILHRSPEGSKQLVAIGSTGRTNEIYRGPGPKNTNGPAPLPPGTNINAWIVFHGQELKAGDSSAGDTSGFQTQLGRAMIQVCAIDAVTQAFFVLQDNDWFEQPLTGYNYRIENPVLSEDQAFYTCWVLQEL